MSLEDGPDDDYVSLTIDIVSAFVGHNSLAASELPGLIVAVHRALAGLASLSAEPEAAAPTPAVSVKRSVQADFLICLEDGKKF